MEVGKIAKSDDTRINDEITASSCRLIGVDGSQLGLFATRDAQRDVGDYETKKGHVLRFLKKGARVKITIMFRGREMAHPEQGLNVLERLAEDLKPYATVESKPKMEGRNMLMLLAPIKGAFDEDKAASDTK